MRYTPGEWYGLVAAGGCMILAPESSTEKVLGLWDCLRSGGGFSDAVQKFVSGMPLASLPDFAIVVLEDTSAHVAVRGHLHVLGSTAHGPVAIEPGAVMTWREEVVTDAVNLAVSTTGAPDVAGTMWPLNDGVARVSRVEVVTDRSANVEAAPPDADISSAGLAQSSSDVILPGAGSPQPGEQTAPPPPPVEEPAFKESGDPASGRMTTEVPPLPSVTEPPVPEPPLPPVPEPPLPSVPEPPEPGASPAPSATEQPLQDATVPQVPPVPAPPVPPAPGSPLPPVFTSPQPWTPLMPPMPMPSVPPVPEPPVPPVSPVPQPPLSPPPPPEPMTGEATLTPDDLTGTTGDDDLHSTTFYRSYFTDEPAETPPSRNPVSDESDDHDGMTVMSLSGMTLGDHDGMTVGEHDGTTIGDDDHDGLTVMGVPGEDHDGMTVMAAPGAAMPFPPPPPPPPDAAPLVLARVCPVCRTPNSTRRVTCRSCGAPLTGEAVQIPRPCLGAIKLPSGQVIPIDHPLVIGRKPEATRFSNSDIPILIVVDDPHVSSTHLKVDLEDWSVLVSSLGRNGTILRRQGQPDRRFTEGEQVIAQVGDVYLLSNDLSVTIMELA